MPVAETFGRIQARSTLQGDGFEAPSPAAFKMPGVTAPGTRYEPVDRSARGSAARRPSDPGPGDPSRPPWAAGGHGAASPLAARRRSARRGPAEFPARPPAPPPAPACRAVLLQKSSLYGLGARSGACGVEARPSGEHRAQDESNLGQQPGRLPRGLGPRELSEMKSSKFQAALRDRASPLGPRSRSCGNFLQQTSNSGAARLLTSSAARALLQLLRNAPQETGSTCSVGITLTYATAFWWPLLSESPIPRICG